MDLAEQFGAIDIYLFDQLLRGRIERGMRVLDVGCGSGRNIVYLLREGYDVFGVDADPRAVDAVKRLSSSLAPNDAMLQGTWRVLKPGGLLFCRLASSIGMEQQVRRLAGRRYLLPDGSERYLVDEAMLVRLTEELGGRLEDPLKTTVVQNQRCMTTWVVRKTR
jgi:hypothetical protein